MRKQIREYARHALVKKQKELAAYEERRSSIRYNIASKYVPKKYEHIDFKPPQGVADEATRGLEYRKEYGMGGTQVGVARATQLKNRENISPDVINRMVSYFARHEVDTTAEGFTYGDDGWPSAGLIAWLLWGGDAGKRWAEKVRDQMDAADEKNKSYKSLNFNEILFYLDSTYEQDGKYWYRTFLDNDMVVKDLKRFIRIFLDKNRTNQDFFDNRGFLVKEAAANFAEDYSFFSPPDYNDYPEFLHTLIIESAEELGFIRRRF